jgi:CRISPR-associated protein Cas2
MRSVYLVSYDICDDRRRLKVYKAMRGVGEHVQFSVFQCELSRRQVVELVAKLETIIHQGEDQVLIVDLGPADGRASTCIQTVGRPFSPLLRRALIL